MTDVRGEAALPPIPFDTRVHKAGDSSQLGTVMPHNPEYTNGRFPVCWDMYGGLWEAGVTKDDVEIVQPSATVTRIAPRPVKRKAAPRKKATAAVS